MPAYGTIFGGARTDRSEAILSITPDLSDEAIKFPNTDYIEKPPEATAISSFH